MAQQPLTISDVAEALGMSKTTVSRAISGKGRVSDETRSRVQAYISEHNYRPNAVARGLAQSRTYNIALVVSHQFSNFDLPFVRKSLTAVCEAAAQSDYEIILTVAGGNNTLPLRRLLDKGKVDGVILTSAIEHNPLVELLQERGTPFVVLGTLPDKSVLQVDNDQVGGCCALTAHMLKNGMERVALLGGTQRYTVNSSRLEGYKQAHWQLGREPDPGLIVMELESMQSRLLGLEQVLRQKPDCILCVDDELALIVLRQLKAKGLRVPQDVRLAAMYDSEELEESEPSITAVHFDAEQLAHAAYRALLDTIDGRPVENNLAGGYQLALRQSTL